MLNRRNLLLGLAALPLAACGSAPEKRAMVGVDKVEELRDMILAMGPGIDPAEAERAAVAAFQHTRELAYQYQIVDAPLIHNTKVNMGLKPRGLCWHWAEDMERLMNSEGFQTLEMHRAISVGRGVRIDHSTSIISRKGDPYTAGVVLDPWREGGTLVYIPVVADTHYHWEAREDVLRRRADLRELAG